MKERTTPYPLRLNPEIRERLEQEAKTLDRSLNWVITNRINKSFLSDTDLTPKMKLEQVRYLLEDLESGL